MIEIHQTLHLKHGKLRVWIQNSVYFRQSHHNIPQRKLSVKHIDEMIAVKIWIKSQPQKSAFPQSIHLKGAVGRQRTASIEQKCCTSLAAEGNKRKETKKKEKKISPYLLQNHQLIASGMSFYKGSLAHSSHLLVGKVLW
jgi:hypothetical protein